MSEPKNGAKAGPRSYRKHRQEWHHTPFGDALVTVFGCGVRFYWPDSAQLRLCGSRITGSIMLSRDEEGDWSSSHRNFNLSRRLKGGREAVTDAQRRQIVPELYRIARDLWDANPEWVALNRRVTTNNCLATTERKLAQIDARLATLQRERDAYQEELEAFQAEERSQGGPLADTDAPADEDLNERRMD